jgi:hypothetical protein
MAAVQAERAALSLPASLTGGDLSIGHIAH